MQVKHNEGRGSLCFCSCQITEDSRLGIVLYYLDGGILYPRPNVKGNDSNITNELTLSTLSRLLCICKAFVVVVMEHQNFVCVCQSMATSKHRVSWPWQDNNHLPQACCPNPLRAIVNFFSQITDNYPTDVNTLIFGLLSSKTFLLYIFLLLTLHHLRNHVKFILKLSICGAFVLQFVHLLL